MFQLGLTYKTLDGKEVLIIDSSNTRGYESVQGDDGFWRYNRKGDWGRCTGSERDNPDNLVPHLFSHVGMTSVEKILHEQFMAPENAAERARLKKQADLRLMLRGVFTMVNKYGYSEEAAIEEIVKEQMRKVSA